MGATERPDKREKKAQMEKESPLLILFLFVWFDAFIQK
jgi:hypothetical protein